MALKLSGVSETLFIPLYCRAIETESKNPIIQDYKAKEIIRKLDDEFVSSSNKLHRALARRKLSKKLTVTMALRTRRIDNYVQDFIKSNDKPVVVNLGCGLDTRFGRVDKGEIHWYDLDFPEVIALRREFFSENDRYHFVNAQDVRRNVHSGASLFRLVDTLYGIFFALIRTLKKEIDPREKRSRDYFESVLLQLLKS